MGAARREPGPGVPARGRPRPGPHLRHRTGRPPGRAAPGRPRHRRRSRCSASTSPRSTPPPTGRPGRCRSPGWSTPPWTSSCSSTCATRSPSCSTPAENSRSPRQEFVAVLAHEPKPFHADGWRGSPGCTRCGPRATSRWRANCGTPARTTPGRSTPPPDASFPTPRCSRPRRRCRRPSTIWRSCGSSPAEPAAPSSAAGGAPSKPGAPRRTCPTCASVGDGDAARPHLVRPQPRGGQTVQDRPSGLATVSAERSIPVENLLTPETPAPARLDAAGAARASNRCGRALADLGARPWQIDATAQTIVDAFVEAGQLPGTDAPKPAS